MIGKRRIGQTLTDERGDRHQTAVAKTEAVGAAPDLAEKDIVVELRELGSEFTELRAPGRLYDLLLCHNI